MKLTLILSALLMGASFSFAADAPKGDKPKMTPEEQFKKLDKNSDGKLSKEEFLGKKEGEAKTKAETAFTAKDTDKDGSLSLAEFSAQGKKKK
jgi:Ca2+-binding EF-hand superfamily protein